MAKKILRVSPMSERLVRDYAKANKLPVGDAADKLVAVGYNRVAALAKFASVKKARPKKERPQSAVAE